MNAPARQAFAAAILVALVTGSAGGGTADVERRNALYRSVDLTAEHQYAEAESVLVSAEGLWPDDAGVSFHFMSLYFGWLDEWGIPDSLSEAFYAYADSTIHRASMGLTGSPDSALLFEYRGLAKLYQSMLRSRVEGIGARNALSLIGSARSGLEDLERVRELDPTGADALLALGNYRYWKGTHLPWPLGTSGDREAGIAMMEEAVSQGLKWPVAGVEALGWAYLREGRFQDVIDLVHPLSERYPACRPLRIQIARARMSVGDVEAAERALREALDRASADGALRPFVAMKIERWLARAEELRGDSAEACARASALLELSYPGVHQKWLEPKLRTVRQIQGRTCGEPDRH